MNTYTSLVQLQKASPRFSIPFKTVSMLNLQVGEEVTCNFWGPDGIITDFRTKVPASREVHVPSDSAKLLTAPSRIYFVEVHR